MIKSGQIDSAREFLNTHPITVAATPKPVRQSKLAEFEEKAQSYLSQFDDPPSALESERALLWQAFNVLKRGIENERLALLRKLERHFRSN